MTLKLRIAARNAREDRFELLRIRVITPLDSYLQGLSEEIQALLKDVHMINSKDAIINLAVKVQPLFDEYAECLAKIEKSVGHQSARKVV